MKLNSIITLTLLLSLCSGSVFAASKNKDKQLPQGLQMKVDRGGSLPPGWQKKLVKGEVLEESVYNHSVLVIPLDSKGLLTVRVEGKLIRLVEATREIIEIVDSLNQ
jgi:23S rRNA C2498 (ribose-2'-O)-methylase RlmM